MVWNCRSQPGGDEEIAPGRQLADEELEDRGFVHALIEVPL